MPRPPAIAGATWRSMILPTATMMKVTTNMMDYQAATGLYTKSIKILKTALGRQA